MAKKDFVCWMADGQLKGVNLLHVVRFDEDENNGITIYLTNGYAYTFPKQFFCESVFPLLGAAIAIPSSQIADLQSE